MKLSLRRPFYPKGNIVGSTVYIDLKAARLVFLILVGLKIMDWLNSVQILNIAHRKYVMLCHFQRNGSIVDREFLSVCLSVR